MVTAHRGLLSPDLEAAVDARGEIDLALGSASNAITILEEHVADDHDAARQPGSWTTNLDATILEAVRRTLPGATERDRADVYPNVGFALEQATRAEAEASGHDPALLRIADAFGAWTTLQLKNFIARGVADGRAEPRIRARLDWWNTKLVWLEGLHRSAEGRWVVAGDVLAETGHWLELDGLGDAATRWCKLEGRVLERLAPDRPDAARALQDLTAWHDGFPARLEHPVYASRSLEYDGVIPTRRVRHRMSELVLEHFIDIAQTRLAGWPRRP